MKINKLWILSLIFLLNACGSVGVGNSEASSSNSAVAQKLASMNWALIGIHDGSKVLKTHFSGVAFSRYQLAFINNRASLKGGCNLANGAVQVNKNKIHFSPMMSTKMACKPSLMKTDAKLGAVLRGVLGFSFETNNTLILKAAKQSLIFRGSPNNENKYGSKGVRKFIQIRNTGRGLVWREAKYNAKYIQINKKAQWNTGSFLGIDGFTPRKNMEYNVRVYEFYDKRLNKNVWVKDMVVMQGVLR